MHLLLVEDEDAIRSALVRGLSTGGSTVDGAATLAEARAKAAAHRPDALITDLKLPDGLGLDLAQELGVPFVQMTGFGTFDDAVRAIRLGCVDFFVKPVSLRELRRSLERIAERGSSAAAMAVIDTSDPLQPVRVQRVGDHLERRPLTSRNAAWSDTATAGAAYRQLAALTAHRRHRQVLAELLRLVPAGRIVINHDAARWTAWLDTGDLIPDGRDFPEIRAHLATLARDLQWLADGGTLAELPGTLPSAGAVAVAAHHHSAVLWRGAITPDELLWPQELPPGTTIDLSPITAIGTWIHEWFRARPGQAVVGAQPEVRRQLEHAGLPVLWRDPRSGVSAAEKADLFADP